MGKIRSGFTLVEVSLFLAITAVIFAGVAIGTQNSIFQQRYNDAVQNYVEFLRTAYSQVSNVQSESKGMSEKAIYGKLITFGISDNKNKIMTYNVIGDIEDMVGSSDGSVLEKLGNLNANVIIEEDGGYKPVGFVDNYIPRWESQIQTTAGWNEDGSGYQIFQGALLIVRSPTSGTIYTYVSDANIDVEAVLNDSFAEKNPIANLSSFERRDVDFCINPNGAGKSNLRRDVRVVDGARNASGVEIVPDDDNRCSL